MEAVNMSDNIESIVANLQLMLHPIKVLKSYVIISCQLSQKSSIG